MKMRNMFSVTAKPTVCPPEVLSVIISLKLKSANEAPITSIANVVVKPPKSLKGSNIICGKVNLKMYINIANIPAIMPGFTSF